MFGNQSPLYFDACLKELYPTIKFGATTYLIPKALFSMPIALVEYLNRYRMRPHPGLSVLGVDPDNAKEFGSDIWPAGSSGAIERHGKTYYAFKQFGVGTSTYVWATKNEGILLIFIDAQTGEVLFDLP